MALVFLFNLSLLDSASVTSQQVKIIENPCSATILFKKLIFINFSDIIKPSNKIIHILLSFSCTRKRKGHATEIIYSQLTRFPVINLLFFFIILIQSFITRQTIENRRLRLQKRANRKINTAKSGDFAPKNLLSSFNVLSFPL